MTTPRAGMLALLMTLACPTSAWALAPAVVGQPLPTLVGRNLNDEGLVLPGALKGRPGVIVAGFSLGARDDATTWTTKIAHQFASKGRVDAFVMVVVEAPAFVEPLVAAALRAGQPADLYKWGVTVMDPERKLRAQWGVADDAKAQVLLIGGDGKVRWATGDGHTGARWARFERAVAEVAPAR